MEGKLTAISDQLSVVRSWCLVLGPRKQRKLSLLVFWFLVQEAKNKTFSVLVLAPRKQRTRKLSCICRKELSTVDCELSAA
jgi:hypothetical protein